MSTSVAPRLLNQIGLNEPAIAELLMGTLSPVSAYVAARAELTAAYARENASGPVIGVRSGDLYYGIHVEFDRDARGVFATVGTDARHRGFAYPTFHDRNATPRGRWLTEALARAFAGDKVVG